MKIILAIVVIVFLLALGCEKSYISGQTCQELTSRFENALRWAMALFDGFSPTETCEDLAPKIIELSKDNEIKFLKISDVKNAGLLKEVIRPDRDNRTNLLFCSAVARTNRDTNLEVWFYLEKDEDGDTFYGYQSGK